VRRPPNVTQHAMFQPSPSGTPSTSNASLACSIIADVSAAPTPSPRAASIAFQTAGKIDPPDASNCEKARSING
jgi:hypothetical protein